MLHGFLHGVLHACCRLATPGGCKAHSSVPRQPAPPPRLVSIRRLCPCLLSPCRYQQCPPPLLLFACRRTQRNSAGVQTGSADLHLRQQLPGRHFTCTLPLPPPAPPHSASHRPVVWSHQPVEVERLHDCRLVSALYNATFSVVRGCRSMQRHACLPEPDRVHSWTALWCNSLIPQLCMQLVHRLRLHC